LTLGLTLCVATIALLVAEVIRKLDALETANSDNIQWTLSQVEVEYLVFYNAVLKAEKIGDEGDLDEVRRRFDIFYSRIATIENSPLYAILKENAEFQEALALVDGFLDDTVPLIDAGDPVLSEAIAPLRRNAAALRDDVRRMSLVGIGVFARQSDIQREGVAQTLMRVATLTLGLILVLTLMILLLMSLNRLNQRRAREIALSGSRLEAMISTSLDAVLVVDTAGRVVEFNGAAEGIFGYAKDETIGRPMTELIFPGHMIAAHEAGMKRYLATGERRVIGRGRIQMEARRKSGEHFPVELSIATADSDDGEIFVSFMRDISDRVAAERELLAARDEALAGEKAKAEFLAVMSHEMRTPLNGLLGAMELLQDTPLGQTQREYLAAMEASGRLLLHHVNDVLDISKLEAGKIRVDESAFDLEALLTEVVDSQMSVAEARGNALVAVPPDPPVGRVKGDPMRLRQVLLNLVGNAVKFTERGEIALEVETLSRRDGRRWVEFRVSDTGIGIADDQIERIFEAFVTLDVSYGRASGGTGLGLGIARRLVRAMDGVIGAESEPGEGSLFWVRLPFAEAGAETLDHPGAGRGAGPAQPELPALDILVVEDNEINRFVVREMLETAGHRVQEAHDGRAGAERAGAERFDVILMDISMPRADGLEATRLIREGGGASHDVPILALTAHAMPDEILRFREAGMNGYVNKPVTRPTLTARLAEAIGLGGRPARGDPGTPAGGGAGGHAPPLIDAGLLDALGDQLGPRAAPLLDRFIAEGDATMARLSQGPAPAEAVATLHAFAGSAATFGAARLRAELARLETLGKTGETEALADGLAGLPPLWSATRAALTAGRPAAASG